MLELSSVAYDGSFCAIFFRHIDLPVIVESIERCEDADITKGDDALVNAGGRMRVFAFIVLSFR